MNLLLELLFSEAITPGFLDLENAPVFPRATKVATPATATTLAITIPAMAPPPNPEDFFVYLVFPDGLIGVVVGIVSGLGIVVDGCVVFLKGVFNELSLIAHENPVIEKSSEILKRVSLSYLLEIGCAEIVIRSGVVNASVFSQLNVTFFEFIFITQSPLESGVAKGIVRLSAFSNVPFWIVPVMIYLPDEEQLLELDYMRKKLNIYKERIKTLEELIKQKDFEIDSLIREKGLMQKHICELEQMIIKFKEMDMEKSDE